MMTKEKWKEIAGQSKMVWCVEVESLDHGHKEIFRVPYADTIENAGLLIGSAPECNIVLADPSIAPRHAKIWHGSNHRLVDVLEGSVGRFTEESLCPPGSTKRFDTGPLFLGRFKIRILEYD